MKPERRNLDHRSVECEDKSNPPHLGRIDLEQFVRRERAIARKGKGLRTPIQSRLLYRPPRFLLVVRTKRGQSRVWPMVVWM